MNLRSLLAPLLALPLALVTGGCASAFRVPPTGIALAVPQGSPVEADIEGGYRVYGAALQPWGVWSADPLYSVHWCPRTVNALTFVPYQAGGHWEPSLDGSPYWKSDDAEAWADITMHHGWWIEVDQSSLSSRWCWIPGAAETAARVVWREADGFVAWAPSPPLYVDDDGQGDDVDLSWSYELLGTLFDDVSSSLLHGDAAAAAHSSTWAEHHHPGSTKTTGAPHHAGAPTASEVSAARHALSSYVTAHPIVGALPATETKRAESTSAPSRTVASGGEGAGESASASSSNASSTSKASSTSSSHTEDPLPPSMALYEQMVHDPFGGPGGIAPSPYLPFLGTAVRTGTSKIGGSSVVPSQYAPSSSSSPSSSHTRTSSHSSSSGHSGSRSTKK
jgi:hypothetical protein